MNEKIKGILIKIILTIPAIFVGLLSAIITFFKPLVDLWFPSSKVELLIEPEPEVKRNFV